MKPDDGSGGTSPSRDAQRISSLALRVRVGLLGRSSWFLGGVVRSFAEGDGGLVESVGWQAAWVPIAVAPVVA